MRMRIAACVAAVSGCADRAAGFPGTDDEGVPAPAPWTIETVAGIPMVGLPSIAVDELGVVHLSYSDSTDLWYAARSRAGTWTTTRIAAALWNDIAVDASGGVHVAFKVSRDGESDLAYAHKPPDGDWTITAVHSAGGGTASLALDARGGVHVTHQGFSVGPFMYSVLLPGDAWRTTTVDGYGFMSSLAIDADGGPHVTYWNPELHLGYARQRTDGKWTVEEIDTQGNVGWHSSLAIDVSGRLHVACLRGGAEEVVYAQGPPWSFEVIDTGGGFYLPSIAVDDRGVDVTYWELEGWRLNHARRPVGGSWTIETIATNAGELTDMTKDACGCLHVGYLWTDMSDPESSREIRYGRSCP